MAAKIIFPYLDCCALVTVEVTGLFLMTDTRCKRLETLVAHFQNLHCLAIRKTNREACHCKLFLDMLSKQKTHTHKKKKKRQRERGLIRTVTGTAAKVISQRKLGSSPYLLAPEKPISQGPLKVNSQVLPS